MNISQIVKQSALDAAMCAVPAIMPSLTRCATVELESDLFGLVSLAVKYSRVPADHESGAEATIDISSVFLHSLDVTSMLTADSMDELTDEILASA